MNILVTGGTGFIGSALTRWLSQKNHRITIVSRSPSSVRQKIGIPVETLQSVADIGADDDFDVVINLAGEPIFGGLWTADRKRKIRASRIVLTDELVNRLARMSQKPKLLISGSAIGYYGDQGDKALTEESEPRHDFAHQLCVDWETSAMKAANYGIRVCLIRTGLVIGRDGGLLKNMILPFRFGLGGRLGSGNQWMSWVHLKDWLRIAETIIEDETMQGVYNATAPNPVTNREFTEVLARCLKKPTLLPVPEFLLKTILGEMSQLVLGSQRIIPQRLLSSGFLFDFNNLENALKDVLKEI